MTKSFLCCSTCGEADDSTHDMPLTPSDRSSPVPQDAAFQHVSLSGTQLVSPARHPAASPDVDEDVIPNEPNSPVTTMRATAPPRSVRRRDADPSVL